MYEFKLADLGEGMHEAEVVQWLIQEGDSAKLDQTIARVETDKAVVELPSPVAGRVSEIRIKDGQVAKVGDVLVVFETTAPTSTDTPAKNAGTKADSSPTQEAASSSVPSTQSAAPPTIAKQRVHAAPAVRKLAFELGVDLEQISPSNPNGRVSLEDVRAYAGQAQGASAQNGAQRIAPSTTLSYEEQHAPELSSTLEQKAEQIESISPVSSSQDERQPLKGLRKRVAEHMERSWRIVPHATAFDEIDGGALVALRQALKPAAEQRGIRLTYMPLLIKLLLPALKEFPIFNASLDEEKREIVYKRSYHIGVAADSPEGLLVPVLRDADRLTLLEIAGRLEKLIEGARKRTLALPELSGSTFTLNNVGSFGGSSGTPIINYPEVAILAVGRLQEKAIAHNGAITVRTMMPLALSFDHRLIDGAMSGRFLARFKELVENPQQLMLDMV